MSGGLRQHVIRALAILLCLFTLIEVNYPSLSPQSQLAIFAMLGIVLCFLTVPAALIEPEVFLQLTRWKGGRLGRMLDIGLALATAVICLYIAVQTEPFFQDFWLDGRSLGDRAGAESSCGSAPFSS